MQNPGRELAETYDDELADLEVLAMPEGESAPDVRSNEGFARRMEDGD